MLRDYELTDKEVFTLFGVTYTRLESRLNSIMKKKSSTELKALFQEMLNFIHEDCEAECEGVYDDTNPTHSRFFSEYQPLMLCPYVTKDWDAKTSIADIEKLFSEILPGLLDDHFSNGARRNPYEVIATALYKTLSKREDYDISLAIKEDYYDDEYYIRGRIIPFSEFAENFVANYRQVNAELANRNEFLSRTDAYDEPSDAEMADIFGDPANRDLLSNVFRTFDLHYRF